MGIFSGKLLVSDIDGTLYCNGEIPKRNLEAIEYFKREGGIFAIATGRSVPASIHIHKEARSNAPLVCFHGGQIYDLKSDKFVYHKILDKRCYDILPVILKEFPKIGVDIFSGKDVFEYRSHTGTRYHAEYEKLTFSPIPKDITSVDWTKILFTVDESEDLDKMEEFCKGLNFPFCKFFKTNNKENARYFEMIPLGVNKGAALKKLKKFFNCDKAYGIGDYYNDIELIADADFGATTAEAPEYIKNMADFVTGPCKNGSVADFIEKIKLL